MVLLCLVLIDKLYSSLFEEQTRAKLVNVICVNGKLTKSLSDLFAFYCNEAFY